MWRVTKVGQFSLKVNPLGYILKLVYLKLIDELKCHLLSNDLLKDKLTSREGSNYIQLKIYISNPY